LRTNIFILILILFVVSLIITLNIFFQQSYQSEIAEQFNRQQLIIAKSIAKNIENQIDHLEDETISFVGLLADRGITGEGLPSFVNNAYVEFREDLEIDLKVWDKQGNLIYSFLAKEPDGQDRDLFKRTVLLPPGDVWFIDALADKRSILLAMPVVRGAEILGAVIMEVMIDSINKKFLAPIRVGIRGHAWMMDGQGTLLFHPTQPEMIGKNLYKTDASCYDCHKTFKTEKKILESGNIGFSSYRAPFGEDKLIAFSRSNVGEMSWIVCVSIPYSEVTYSIRKSMKLHSLLVISIFIATIAGTFATILINRKRVKAEEKAKHLERQKYLEDEIIQAKDYLENLLQSTESKIMVLDKDLTIRTVNTAHQELCKKGKDYIIGKNFFDIFPIIDEKSKDTFREIFAGCLEGTSRMLHDFPYETPEKTLYLNISINPLILHGTVSGIILSSNEITEEVHLRETLRDYAAKLEGLVRERTDELLNEKEKLNAIVETLEAGLFIVDSERKITWINRTLRDWMGIDDIGDLSLDRIYSGTDIQRSIVDNNVVQEIIFQDLGKRKGYFQITSTPLISSDGTHQALVLVQDITEMKKMEEQMMHSEKLSDLARISAGVAHEVGNPLTSISSYVQILRAMDFDSFTKETLDTIAKHVNRIISIVRQMSSFSKTTASNLQKHNIRGIVDATLELVRYDKRMKNVTIQIDVSDNLPEVNVDDTQLIQVFMNIIFNAADAMPDTGTLDITAKQTGNEIEIAFSDTGHGVPAEYAEKIFEPFFTTKEKGTGLGLGVSYSIMKSFNGDISFENKPEGGSIFRVRLPGYEK
jgi:C4-dicarboxylate-specific signal transduction histidine kinase